MNAIAERLEIRELARSFAQGDIRPHVQGWERAGDLDDAVFRKLAELGFLGMRVPEPQGGLGFDAATYVTVLEELAWGDAALALSVAIHCGPVSSMLLTHGSEPQRSAWLPKLASGEVLGAFALSEAGAGSDPSSMETRAERDGDGWRLTGTKRWVTNGRRAGLVVVFARSGPGGVSAFLVDPGSDGYRVGGREKTMGLKASETVDVELDGVRVGPEGLLGREGKGLACALEAVDVGRVGIAAQAVGIGRAAMDHALAYALERRQFGQALADFGATRAKLAEMHRRLEGARALALRAAEALDAGAEGRSRTGPDGLTARAAVAKLAASEAATWVADEAVQIFGGYGYMKEYPVEKLLRDAKGTEIYEGTNEIMRHVIARELLRAARDV